MEITEVRLWPVNHPSLKANVAITFEHQFVVTGLKVINGSKGPFVQMPSKKIDNPRDPNKPYIDTSFPKTPEFKKYLNDVVMMEYNSRVGGGNNQNQNQNQNQNPAQSNGMRPPNPDDDLPF